MKLSKETKLYSKLNKLERKVSKKRMQWQTMYEKLHEQYKYKIIFDTDTPPKEWTEVLEQLGIKIAYEYWTNDIWRVLAFLRQEMKDIDGAIYCRIELSDTPLEKPKYFGLYQKSKLFKKFYKIVYLENRDEILEDILKGK